jgi:hypothetical protein
MVAFEDLEDLLLSYSHATDLDLYPIWKAFHSGIDLVHTLRDLQLPKVQKAPTIAKLLSVCTFLSHYDGLALRYCYRLTCDIVHSGPASLALSDYMDNRQSNMVDNDTVIPGMHGLMGVIIGDAYPRLCYEVLRCTAMFFSRHVVGTSNYTFSALIDEFLRSSNTPGIASFECPEIRMLINGDNSIVLDVAGNRVRVYK